MFDLLKSAEKRATKAVAVFERAAADLRTANDHLAAVKATARADIDAVKARAEAEVARVEDLAKALVAKHTARHLAADGAQAKNSSILDKIEGLLR